VAIRLAGICSNQVPASLRGRATITVHGSCYLDFALADLFETAPPREGSEDTKHNSSSSGVYNRLQSTF
jgi:hypothetical protein